MLICLLELSQQLLRKRELSLVGDGLRTHRAHVELVGPEERVRGLVVSLGGARLLQPVELAFEVDGRVAFGVAHEALQGARLTALSCHTQVAVVDGQRAPAEEVEAAALR